MLLHYRFSTVLELTRTTLCLQAASQWITLLFIGFVSFNSLRAFLKHMRRLYVAVSVLFGAKETTSPSPAINSRLVLVLAGLLSVYTISSLMLLRAQLPVTHRNLVTLALGFLGHETNVEFDAIHRCALLVHCFVAKSTC